MVTYEFLVLAHGSTVGLPGGFYEFTVLVHGPVTGLWCSPSGRAWVANEFVIVRC